MTTLTERGCNTLSVQPQGPCQINPAFAGDLWYSPGGGGVSIALGGGTPAFAYNKNGKAFSGNGSTYYTGTSKTYNANGQGLTIVFSGGGCSSSAAMIAGDHTTTGNFIWLNDGSGNIEIRLNATTLTFSGAAATSVGNYVFLVGRSNGGSTIYSLYRNGVLVSSQTTSPLTFTQNTVGNGYTSTTYALNGQLNLLHFINSAVTPQQAASLSANPWQVFTRPAYPLFVASGGGGNTVAPGAGHLVLTGYAPTVNQGQAQGAAPGKGHLAFTGYAPSIVQGQAQGAAPGKGALRFSGYAPSVSNGAAVFPLPNQVALGVVYGPNGNDYIGTLVGTGAVFLRRR